MTVPDATVEDLMRLKAWRVALRDAYAYLAIARHQPEDPAGPSTWVETPVAEFHVSSYTTKALVTAAVISLCQILGQGNAGVNISANVSVFAKATRSRLYEVSDRMNAWASGTTAGLFAAAKSQRDSLIAHFDGSVAHVAYSSRIIEPTGLTGITMVRERISWQTPNPPYDSGSFPELDRALPAMISEIDRMLNELKVKIARKGVKE